MADRYTYIPLIGIFLALGWCIPAPPIGCPATGATVCGVLVLCGVATFRQTQGWRGSEELWSSSVKADDNPVSHCYYGGALYGKAVDFYDEAEKLSRKGRTTEADHRIADAKLALPRPNDSVGSLREWIPICQSVCPAGGVSNLWRGFRSRFGHL